MHETRWTYVLYLALIVSVSPGALHADDSLLDVDVLSSDPPNGYVDVRSDRDVFGNPQGISTISITLNQEVDLSARIVDVISTIGTLRVLSIEGGGREWSINLDGPIPAGESTIVSIDEGSVLLSFHSRPGDVNLDGVSNEEDVRSLMAAISSKEAAVQDLDINRDGIVSIQDVEDLQIILEGSDGMIAWADVVFPLPVTGQCCCIASMCFIHPGDCPIGSTKALVCPCQADSCDIVGSS